MPPPVTKKMQESKEISRRRTVPLTMSFSGKVRPPAVDTDDAMEATDVPEVRRGIAPDVRRTGATLGDGGIGDDICYFSLCVCVCVCVVLSPDDGDD